MTAIPDDLRYSQDHLWVRVHDGTSLVRAGVTDFAQQSLGDVVDLIAPITGTVRARNDDLTRTPGLVNTDPYGQGWLFEVEADPAALSQQLAGLMDADDYRGLAGA
jgi:glycine cleavage system H protein